MLSHLQALVDVVAHKSPSIICLPFNFERFQGSVKSFYEGTILSAEPLVDQCSELLDLPMLIIMERCIVHGMK